MISLALVSMGWASDGLMLEQAVSTSRGRKGGYVVMWPRVIPHSADSEVHAAAAAVQELMVEVVSKAAPVAHQDIRPEPERVCRRDRGCRGAAVSVLIGHEAGGCVAVGLVNAPGLSAVQLIPLAGEVELASTSVPFRAAPESVVTVREMVPCASLVQAMDTASFVQAVRRAGQ